MADSKELQELKEIPKYKHLYFFEVQFHNEKKGFTHVGYMHRLFASKKDAALYYKIYNPDLNFNAFGTSDWDPETKLRYKLHKYNFEELTIKPFDGIIEDRVWLYKPFSPLGKKVKLGLAMQKGPGKPKAEFPLCPSKECFCYDCAMDTVAPSNINDEDYDEDNHRLLALRKAKQLRENYLLNISQK
jgi:hypothetical protein